MTPLRTLAVRAVGIAVGYAQAHIHEEGANRGPQIEFWQRLAGGIPGESYCADFVYGCFVKADCVLRGVLVGKDQHESRIAMFAACREFSKRTGIPRTGYCPTIEKVAREYGRFHGPAFVPAPGDIVLFRFDERKESHHCGLVIDPRTSVQGNTSPGRTGNQSDGQGVYAKATMLEKVWGYVHFM